MKIAVTGSKGNLGKELVKRGCIPIDTDITNEELIRNEIEYNTPDVLIHCAALTNVAYCESHYKEAFDVNVRGTSNVASVMPKDSLFIYISTDHVFDGESYFNSGYGEWHTPSPVNFYGFTKWGGETILKFMKCNTLIIRSSRCFDYAWAQPTMDILRDGGEVVMTDLIKRSFVHANHFIDGLLKTIELYPKIKDEYEILNISGDSAFSYYHFWFILNNYFKFPGKVVPRREKLKDADPRPFRAGLNVERAKKLKIPIFNIKDGFGLLKEGI